MAGISWMSRTCVLAGALAIATNAFAVNRIEINDVEILLNSTGVEIAVLGDLDQDIYAFSVAGSFDRSEIRITDIRVGDDVGAVDFSDGQINNSSGEFSWGVVLGLNQANIERHVNAGQNVELLVLTIDVVATSFGSTDIDLRNGNTPGETNVFTDSNGDSVSPDPTLNDGRITFPDLSPSISSITNNIGASGRQFTVNGDNFDQADLTVEVCNNDAVVTVNSATRLTVTAPTCGSTGWQPLVVTTVQGQASEANGFNYTVADAAPILSDPIQNRGVAGRIMFCDGENLAQPGLRVSLGGIALEETTEWTLLPGVGRLRTLQITVPEGLDFEWNVLEVCTDFGCDDVQEGFFNTAPRGGLQVPGDCNQDSNIDLSDALCIFGHLFLGNPVDLPCDTAEAEILLVDWTGDGAKDLSDGVSCLAFLFRGGPPHPLTGLESCSVMADCPDSVGCP